MVLTHSCKIDIGSYLCMYVCMYLFFGRRTSFIEPPDLVLFLLHSLGSPYMRTLAGSDETHFVSSRGISVCGGRQGWPSG